MAKSVRISFKSPLLGEGKNQSGLAVNNKLMVGGRIVITSYATGGEPLTANDLGLATLDEIFFNVESMNNAATVPAAATIGHAGYDRTGQRMVLDTTGTTEVSSTEAAVVRFFAIGDSAAVADLT